jgi:hypothetical protein
MARDGLELSKSLGFDLSSVSFAPPEESARAIKKVVCVVERAGDMNVVEATDWEINRLMVRLRR